MGAAHARFAGSPTRTAVAVRHVAFEDLGVIAPLLAERGYRVRTVEAGVDPLDPESLVDADLVVVLGGPIGVYETRAYPFLLAEKRAIEARLAAGGATLGVCLGAQLIADVLGARVAPSGRREIGYGPLTVAGEGSGSVLAPLHGLPVLHWHGDTFAIPDGAVRLAETPGFPNQAFALGDAVLGLQFHIEADPERIERWLIGHAVELAAAGVAPGEIRTAARLHGPALAALAGEVFGAWLDRAVSDPAVDAAPDAAGAGGVRADGAPPFGTG